MAKKSGDNLQDEQQAYCKIRGKLGYSALEIKSDLDKVYGESALPYRTVARWVSLFRGGRENIQDEPRPGRPATAVSDKDVASVKVLIEEYALYTVEELANLSGLNLSAVLIWKKRETQAQEGLRPLGPPLIDTRAKAGPRRENVPAPGYVQRQGPKTLERS